MALIESTFILLIANSDFDSALRTYEPDRAKLLRSHRPPLENRRSQHLNNSSEGRFEILGGAEKRPFLEQANRSTPKSLPLVAGRSAALRRSSVQPGLPLVLPLVAGRSCSRLFH